MRLRFDDKQITGLALVLPSHEQSFLEDMKAFDFPESRSLKLMKVMGYGKHRLVEPGVCSSDLAVHGLREMVAAGDFSPTDVDALIVITQSPDYLMPPTSSVIHAELGFKQDLICIDIPQGCAGYLIGLIQAFMMLDQPSIRQVVLINVDVLSRKVSPRDRNSFPLIGDAAAITLVERGGGRPIWANVRTDGTRREALMIPAGGMRLPSSPETAVIEDAGDNNHRAKDHLRMDGTGVFNFVQTEVPPLIDDLFDFAGISDADVRSYAFHQPNRFMLEKLAEKLGIAKSKMPMDVVERFGNSSGVTIPTVLATNLAESLLSEEDLYCLAGFGVGLTWASMAMTVGRLRFCRVFEF
jgi:3-oxoacyl-[acyl-carrier-protein] synthase-3